MTAITSAEPLRPSMRRTLSNALIITRREVRDSFRDWRIIAPIIILTFFFPFLAQSVAANFSNFLAGFGAQIIGERTIPFLLMVVGFFPISISLVIALETFVGEKERRSLEPLLSTPLSNTELYIGKTLAAMIPPLLASFGGMVVYLLTLLGGELAWRPPAMLIVQIFILTIVQALVMVTGAVVVSSQTTSTRAANLLASFIIIPMALVINGESVIMFLAPDANSPNGIGALWAIAAGMLLVVVLLLRMGNAIFNREELLGRMIDQISLGGTLRKMGRYVLTVDEAGTPARSLGEWYRRGIGLSLSRLRIPIVLSAVVFAVAFGVGMFVGTLPELRLPLPSAALFETALTNLRQNNSVINDLFGSYLGSNIQRTYFMSVFSDSLRVLALGVILSTFSFGAAAFIVMPLTYVIAGYVLMQFLAAGYGAELFLTAFVPHNLVKIPVAILATAALFRLGAVVTRPPRTHTLGHAWIVAFGDMVKISLGIVIPGLFVAGLLEVTLTPWLLLNLLS